MTPTRDNAGICDLLDASPGYMLAKRELYKKRKGIYRTRIGLWGLAYDQLLRDGIIWELGNGKKGEPTIVALHSQFAQPIKPEYDPNPVVRDAQSIIRLLAVKGSQTLRELHAYFNWYRSERRRQELEAGLKYVLQKGYAEWVGKGVRSDARRLVIKVCTG